MLGIKNGINTNCENCGKEIYKTMYQYNKKKHHFCSNECAIQWRKNINSIHKKCEICGKDMIVTKSSNKRFCSVQCQNEWQKTNTGNKNPKYERIPCFCSNCNKPLYITKSNHNRYNEHFCDSKCRQEWYTNIYSQNETWREESRKRAVNILNNNKTTTMTKPQKIINELLDNMIIKYENEKGYDYYSVDNYITNNNLIIEVMGDFWHCNPTKYIEVKQDIQKRRITKDKAKHNYILNNYGIEILYLWEKDIYENLDLCKYLINYYIDSKGKLKNFNSFNYVLDNDTLKLNDNIIKNYFEK